MFKLRHVRPEEAQGQVRDIYASFPDEIGVPETLQLASISPEYLKLQYELARYFMNHNTLPFHLLAAIRYLVATERDFEYCRNFNSKILKAAGMSDEDLAAMFHDPRSAPFEERERALLAFVMQSLRDPDWATPERIDNLRALDWTDADIYEATAHGSHMIATSRLFAVFKEDEPQIRRNVQSEQRPESNRQ